MGYVSFQEGILDEKNPAPVRMGWSKLNHWNSWPQSDCWLTNPSDAKNIKIWFHLSIYIRVPAVTVKALIWRFFMATMQRINRLSLVQRVAFRKYALPAKSLEILRKTGAIMWQGPHDIPDIDSSKITVIKINSKSSSCQKNGVSITSILNHVHMWHRNVAKSSIYSNWRTVERTCWLL